MSGMGDPLTAFSLFNEVVVSDSTYLTCKKDGYFSTDERKQACLRANPV